jgi:hypothetical protein
MVPLSSDRYEAAPDRAVDLRTLAGAPLGVTVRELRVDSDGGIIVADAMLELDGAVYGRCLDEELFGLDAPGRGPGPEPALDRPVRLAVRLRAHLAERLRGEDPMAALIEQLFVPGGAVAHAEAWRALDVTQHDDALGGAMGYRTAWGAE